MLSTALEKRLKNSILFSVVIVTLVIDPLLHSDSFGLPKLLLLVSSSFFIFGNLLPVFRRTISCELRGIIFGVLSFILVLFLAFGFSSSSKWGQIYGDYGRNTGLLAYFSLALLLLSAIFVSNRSFVQRLMWALIVTGISNAVYGLFQWAELDPISWNNPYDPIVGTLGNPNFTSAHLGMASLASLAIALSRSEKLVLKVALFLNIGLSLFVISQSTSSQGLLIFALGFVVIFYFRFIASLKLVAIKFLYWAGAFFGVMVGVLGILNKGPLASYLYQASVTYRGDYWRAGWKMTLENPLLGVGLDSYGSWYRFYRNEAATLRRGPDVTSNSAHNVFLDISSNGGFLLFVAYLAIFALIIKSGWRIIRKSDSYDPISIALVTSWLAYLVQSLISINQLGLAVWGWVMGGAIIGYDLYKDRPDGKIVKTNSPTNRKQVSASSAILGTLGLASGIAIAIWPSAQDINFRSALQGGDPTRIESAAKSFPGHNYYYNYSSQIFLTNNLEDKALELSRIAVAKNPRDFNAWKTLIDNPKISSSEKADAIKKMKELDPFNNTLGQ